MIENYTHVRDAVRRKLHDKQLTLTEMRRAIASDCKALCGLDSSFIIEIAYLNGPMDTLLTNRVHGMVLKALPSESSVDVTWQTALSAVKEISMGAACKAGGASLTGEIEGVLSLIRKVREGQSPDPERVQRMSPFFRSALHHLSFFCQFKEAALLPHPLRFGRQAVTLAIEDLKKDAATDVGVELSKTKLLRQLEWMLSQDAISSPHTRTTKHNEAATAHPVVPGLLRQRL